MLARKPSGDGADIASLRSVRQFRHDSLVATWRPCMWVVVKIRAPFLVLIIVRHLIFRVPKKGDPNFDNHPCVFAFKGNARRHPYTSALKTCEPCLPLVFGNTAPGFLIHGFRA